MEFFETHQTLIIVIAIAIVVIAIYSFISKRRRQKQENEMNNVYNYSSSSISSKPKAPKIETKKQTQYKFSPETGELINKLENDGTIITETSEEICRKDVDDILTYSNKTQLDGDMIDLVKMNLDNLNITEERKQQILDRLQKRVDEKPDNDNSIQQKIQIIENSKMSEKQKMKLIELLKKKGNL